MNDTNDLKDIDKRKIQQDCAKAPIAAAHGLEEFGKANEDSWFREHEAELIEAARARKKASNGSGEIH